MALRGVGLEAAMFAKYRHHWESDGEVLSPQLLFLSEWVLVSNAFGSVYLLPAPDLEDI